MKVPDEKHVFKSKQEKAMIDSSFIGSLVLVLFVGCPFAFLGLLHLVFPKHCWGVYRAWSKLWGMDPQKVAPDYNPTPAMRAAGLAFFIGGLFISLLAFLIR